MTEPVGGNILSTVGMYLELTCSAKGTPLPGIVWLRGSTTRVGSGNKLNLGFLKKESSGHYTCVASNLVGEDRKTTKLNVTCTYHTPLRWLLQSLTSRSSEWFNVLVDEVSVLSYLNCTPY